MTSSSKDLPNPQNHDDLPGFVGNEHIDWTQPGAGTIDPDNYVAGGSDADAIHVDVAEEILGLTAKTIPTGSDIGVIEDAADSHNKKKIALSALGVTHAHADFGGAGSAGFVPNPVTETGKFLKDDATWDTPTDTDTVYTHPNHSGDVTSVGDGAQTIANGAVSNAKLVDMATQRIKGRTTAGTGDPEDLTAAQVLTMLGVETGATADQTGAEIKAAYESELDTNAFDDAAVAKLSGIEAGADVTDADNVATAGAFLADGSVPMGGDISLGTNGLTATGSASRYVLVHNGTRYVGDASLVGTNRLMYTNNAGALTSLNVISSRIVGNSGTGLAALTGSQVAGLLNFAALADVGTAAYTVGYIVEADGTDLESVLHHPSFQGRATGAQTWDGTTRYLDWDAEDFKEGSAYTHSTSTNPSQITINQAGVYEITYDVTASVTTLGIMRSWLELDPLGVGSFATVTGTGRYSAGAAGYFFNVGLRSFRITLAATDILRVAFTRYVAGAGATTAGASHICIRKVRST